jgi:hypothetical protein
MTIEAKLDKIIEQLDELLEMGEKSTPKTETVPPSPQTSPKKASTSPVVASKSEKGTHLPPQKKNATGSVSASSVTKAKDRAAMEALLRKVRDEVGVEEAKSIIQNAGQAAKLSEIEDGLVYTVTRVAKSVLAENSDEEEEEDEEEEKEEESL